MNTASSGTAPHPDCSPERSNSVTDGIFFTPLHGPAVGATAGATGTMSGLTSGTTTTGSISANSSTATAADGKRTNSDATIAEGEGEFRKAEKGTSTIETTDGGTGKNEGKEKGKPLPTIGRGVRGGMGSKWSLRDLRGRLAGMGLDVPALWGDINDSVIKTLIAIEAQVKKRRAHSLFGYNMAVVADSYGVSVVSIVVLFIILANLLCVRVRITASSGQPQNHCCPGPAVPCMKIYS